MQPKHIHAVLLWKKVMSKNHGSKPTLNWCVAVRQRCNQSAVNELGAKAVPFFVKLEGCRRG